MLIQIAQKAPLWVWPLLAGLVALGVSQRRDRSIALPRATIVPLVMVGLSFVAVTSAFGAPSAALLTWAAGLAAAAGVAHLGGMWSGIVWRAAERRLHVPGSWMPLVLILAIFATRFTVGALIATQPALKAAPMFGMGVGLAYGLFSGLFLGRGMAMWHAARGARPALA
jgi:hypothetical protein|nr:DUF6622 family protein [uncultured Caldimonas sp.]